MSNIDSKTVELIIDSIKDVRSDIHDLKTDMSNNIKDFRDDAHEKIGKVENSLNKRIDEIKDKLVSIEATNKRIEAHEVEIRQIKNDLNELAKMTRENKEDFDNRIEKHCKDHPKLVDDVIRDTVKTYKAGIVTKILAWGGSFSTIAFIIAKLTGFLDKIKIGIIK